MVNYFDPLESKEGIYPSKVNVLSPLSMLVTLSLDSLRHAFYAHGFLNCGLPHRRSRYRPAALGVDELSPQNTLVRSETDAQSAMALPVAMLESNALFFTRGLFNSPFTCNWVLLHIFILQATQCSGYEGL